MSDWFGSRSTAPTSTPGSTSRCPGPPRDRGAKLIAAVEAGEVEAATVRRRALNVLRLMRAHRGARTTTGRTASAPTTGPRTGR